MSTFFVSDKDSVYSSLTVPGYAVFIGVIVLALLVACFFTNTQKKTKFSTRQLVVSGMAVALAFVTSNFKIIHLPQGGSVTLFSMFFICFVGYLYGLRSGLMAGVAYGILQMITDPYVISVPQLFIDYILAFGALGLAGIVSGKKYGMVSGYVVGILGRLIFAVISGVIFFGSYAPKGQNVWIYSLSYNGIYILAEGAITVAVLAVPSVRKGLANVRILLNESDAKCIEAQKVSAH
ncbi:energy-coupled thiamine transporter ThiT [Butyrivibrio sp. NC3005]|uniref:energy-coupled thiamine transporter ThiT n=1 Tax=Butyrivibrio sp. NC3005 TaxID=1280685 RepID=UPI0004101B8F|nr:energy-coupled thiamine transporter ThiT [Butyrivibrio sp. NC3005]